MRDVELVWRSAEPELATRRLVRRLGLPEAAGEALRFTDGTLLRGGPSEDAFDRLEVVGGVVGGRPGRTTEGVALEVPYELLALGLASPVLRDQVGAGEPLDEPVLGARGVPFDAEWGPVVLLEPATEGRLAAFLARFGPAACAVYLRATPSAPRLPSTAAGPRVADGVLGRTTLVAGGPPFGPFVLLVERAAGVRDGAATIASR